MSEVHVVLPGGQQVHAGTLVFDLTPAGTLAAAQFTYSREYLSTPEAYPLSPDLPLSPSRTTSARLFGCFRDAQPDSWGRHLLAVAARRQGRRVTELTEEDFLLDVHDETRVGALRLEDHGEFRAPSHDGIPTLVSVDRLVAAAHSTTTDTDDPEGMALLLAAGSSMGGARPKATVRGPDGALHLAKFPAIDDRWDVQRWEAATLRLASNAGIDVPWFALIHSRHGYDVLLLRRFDRTANGTRVGYISAATLLEHDFGSGHKPDYVSLSEDLQANSGSPERDAHELFRRVAFTLLVRNTDDHLRNHGLVRDTTGWRLSPSFDVNPQPLTGISLSPTPITVDDDDSPDRDIRRLVENAASFRLTRAAAVQIVHEVEDATSSWATVAVQEGVDPDEIPFFSKAFDNPNRERARLLTPASPTTVISGASRPRPQPRDSLGRFDRKDTPPAPDDSQA